MPLDRLSFASCTEFFRFILLQLVRTECGARFEHVNQKLVEGQFVLLLLRLFHLAKLSWEYVFFFNF